MTYWEKKKEVVENIKKSDVYVSEHFPSNQPYIYTAKGNAIVFEKIAGFDPKEAGNT